jgi:hypothetical protein
MTGVLVAKDGSTEMTLVEMTDFYTTTQLTTTHVSQQMRVPCHKWDAVKQQLSQVYADIQEVLRDDNVALQVFDDIYVVRVSPKEVLLDWNSIPTTDMIVDSIIALIAHCETNPFASERGTQLLAMRNNIVVPETEILGFICVALLQPRLPNHSYPGLLPL